MQDKHDGTVVKKYNELNHRLKPFGLVITPWGRLAVAEIGNERKGYILNNVLDINVIEGFVKGLEYSKQKSTN